MFTSAESFTLCDVTWESQSSPFDRHYGLEIDEATDEVVRAHVPVREHLLQPVGVVPDGNIGLGMSNNSTFLRSIREGTIHATARRVHGGRTTWVWDVELKDDEGRLCAVSRVTIAVRPLRP